MIRPHNELIPMVFFGLPVFAAVLSAFLAACFAPLLNKR